MMFPTRIFMWGWDMPGKCPKFQQKWPKFAILCLILCIIPSCQPAYCNEIDDYELARAIFKAEGGLKADYLFGIRSVKYDTPAEAWQICLNTIRNNKIRFQNQSKYNDYLTFLASRYCPIGCDNDRGTNKYWLRNVRFHLNQ